FAVVYVQARLIWWAATNSAHSVLFGKHARVSSVRKPEPCLQSTVGFFAGVSSVPFAVVSSMAFPLVTQSIFAHVRDRAGFAERLHSVFPVFYSVIGVELAARFDCVAAFASLFCQQLSWYAGASIPSTIVAEAMVKRNRGPMCLSA